MWATRSVKGVNSEKSFFVVQYCFLFVFALCFFYHVFHLCYELSVSVVRIYGQGYVLLCCVRRYGRPNNRGAV